MEYRDESQRLDQCSRLYDSSVSNNGFELDASYIVQVHVYLCGFLLSSALVIEGGISWVSASIIVV